MFLYVTAKMFAGDFVSLCKLLSYKTGAEGAILLLYGLTILNTIAVLVMLFFIRMFISKPAAETTNMILLEKSLERLERQINDEFARNREEAARNARALREEVSNILSQLNESVINRLHQNTGLQLAQLKLVINQLKELTTANEQKIEAMRQTLLSQLQFLQEDNNKKLEQMRITVDEKLHATLEQRLGESFRLVSERLEQVHKGLGEMQTLASGVGDLKRVLTNVKTRGIWGEVHLGNLLEQILTPEQYCSNINTKPGSSERVEFAIKLPGREKPAGIVYLPVDAKFPQEDYHRLLDAQEAASPALAEETAKALENRIKFEAKQIAEKYISPPSTTDFGIMFLPVEGLYAEVLRRPGLYETLLREYRIVVSGPTTLAALLNSLQLGFRTLAVEKRSSEVWALLGSVKTEFHKFGVLLQQTQKKLETASKAIDIAAQKSRTIERRLRDVEELPEKALGLLGEIGDSGQCGGK